MDSPRPFRWMFGSPRHCVSFTFPVSESNFRAYCASPQPILDPTRPTLGNSPREFTKEKVQGRTIAMTTTNGTRALRSCARAWTVFVGSFLNLRATSQLLQREPPRNLLLVCSGTFDQAAYEDVLGAGALGGLLWPTYSTGAVSE